MESADLLTEKGFAAQPLIAFAAADHAVAVAVSGGPDSMALCYLLSRWAEGLQGVTQIHAITVDHGLREEAAEEARTVGAWLSSWPCIKHTILTRKTVTEDKESRVMERARDDRYRLMAEYCRANGIAKLFIAHHLDDQSETFLFRLAKGSGLDGLAAMQDTRAYDEALTLCRPLLGIAKEELIAFCKAHNIPFVSDPSNDDTGYARPRLRQAQDVLAREGLSAKRLSVTALRLGRAREALAYYAAGLFDQALLESSADILAFDCDVLTGAPRETRLRVLQMALAVFAEDGDNGYGPRMEKLEALEADIFDQEDFKGRTLGGCLFALKNKGMRLEIRREKE